VHTIIRREDNVRRSKKVRAGEHVMEIATVKPRETRLPPPPLQQHQSEDEDYFETFVRGVNHERREQAVQDQIQSRRRAQAVEDVIDLPVQLSQWHDICPLCMVRSRKGVRH
jgi:hypothetical protein